MDANPNKRFENRIEAGTRLAMELLRFKDKNPIVFALPRGGVPVGFEISKILDAPLDVLVVRKLGAPANPEFGIGAIAPGGVRVFDDQVIHQFGISEKQLDDIEKKEQAELERRVRVYGGIGSIPEVQNMTVILADDGLATGVTMQVAIKAVLRKKPKKLVIAIPVCARDSMDALRSTLRISTDEVECLMTLDDFKSVGTWYRRFEQVSDQEVVDLLDQANTHN